MNEGAVYGHSHTVTLTNAVPTASAATVIRLSNVPTTSNGVLTRARTLPLTGLMSWSLADPAVGGSTAQGYRRVYAQFGDGRRWSPVVSDSLYVDLVRPTTTAPMPRFPQPGRIAPAGQIPVRLTWSARDSGSGLSSSELQYTTDDVRWFGAAGNPAYTANGSRYRFRVRVVDRAGNWSNWAVGPIFWVNAYQESYTGQRYAGTWTRVSSSGAYGGYTKYSTVTRSSVTQTFTGRAVGIVAPTGPTRGYARVYFDGVLVAVINLNSATENPRQFVYQRAWTTSGTHTIRMEVSGTAGHPRVDLDAILVLR
jgi:hypothetical protein